MAFKLSCNRTERSRRGHCAIRSNPPVEDGSSRMMNQMRYSGNTTFNRIYEGLVSLRQGQVQMGLRGEEKGSEEGDGDHSNSDSAEEATLCVVCR